MARVISTILNRKIKIPKKGETKGETVIVCEAMRVITENIKAELVFCVNDTRWYAVRTKFLVLFGSGISLFLWMIPSWNNYITVQSSLKLTCMNGMMEIRDE